MLPEVGPGAALCDALIRRVEKDKKHNLFKNIAKKNCFHLVTGGGVPKKGSPGGVPVWPYETKLNVFCTRRGAPETAYPLDAVPRFKPYRPHVKDNAGLAGANSLK